jgi:hypothetical protein
MRILIVENVSPPSRQEDDGQLRREAEEMYGDLEAFDVVIGLDEDGNCPVIKGSNQVTSVETIMR